MRKYKLRCQYCGAETHKYEWLLKIRLIFTNKYILDCPTCHKKTSWLYIFHLRHDSTDKVEQKFNKGKIFDNRIKRG